MSEPFRRKPKEELPLLERAVIAIEEPLKGRLFDCQMCGQCILSNTGYVCPMGCPKGLRNGPCGGTLDGRCEVHPEMKCVWLDIYDRRSLKNNTRSLPPFQAPIDRDLVGTSSYVNLLTGRDRKTRKPVRYGELSHTKGNPTAGDSALARRLGSGRFALTAEIHSPKSTGALDRVEQEAKALAPMVDAVNATSNAGGKASVSSLDAAVRILAAGAEPVLQICGRDVDVEAFHRELGDGWSAGAKNLLCLTGDWSGPRMPRSDRKDPWPTYFPMDSSQMIYEARGWRYFVGGVINPFTTPVATVLARLAQKIACGAEFIQTQAVLDVTAFQRWLGRFVDSGLSERVYLLPSVPLILSLRSLDILSQLPGVYVPEHVRRRLQEAVDDDGRCDRAGLDLAEEICAKLVGTPGVDGIHLMIFGGTWIQVTDWVSRLRAQTDLVHPGRAP